MKLHKFRVTLLLMGSSMLLLLVLQGLWLRSEYKAASDSFKRETNIVFRSTMQHLADSMWVSQIKLLPGLDSISFEQMPTFRLPGRRLLSDLSERDAVIDSGDKQKTDTVAAKNSGNRRISILSGGENEDYRQMSMGDTLNSHQKVRMFLNMFAENFDPDTLKTHYQKALVPRFQNMEISIIQKEFNWFQHGWNRHQQDHRDSIPYATNFFPMGINKAYAANFDDVSRFLLQGIFPQIGFSVFISGLILFSFIMVYRSLLAQQRLIEQKNDFIGNMTHELKTPVATVGVALEAMSNFDVLKDPERASEYIDMARHELERLSMMTDKILKTSVFDYETEIRNNKTSVYLSVVISKVMSSFYLVSEKTNTRIIYKGNDNLIIQANEEHLTQMLYNLVDNAFKYAGEESEVIIGLEDHPGHILLYVKDNGPGIAEIYQSRIFEKFYRVPSGNVHSVKGYGLGLNYVQGVAKSHGGKVSLQSRNGQGATFEVKIPKNG